MLYFLGCYFVVLVVLDVLFLIMFFMYDLIFYWKVKVFEFFIIC